MHKNCFRLAQYVLVFQMFAAAQARSQAGIIIEGVVALPPPKAPSAAFARYAQKAGKVNPPEPPRAVVYLEGTFPAPAAPLHSATAVVEQKSYQFVPGVLPIMKGTAIEFPNDDDDYHHVFSYSKAKQFDLGRFRKDEKPPAVKFDKAGVVKIGCEIHDHMRGFILVLETPYFSSTETNGAYRLVINEPLNGAFLLKAWIDDKTMREQAIELKDGASLRVDFPGR